MSLSTALVSEFGGQNRVFKLRIGEMGELETLCGTGIAGIYSRLATLQFRYADVRETIRLGLIGGGMVASEAAFLMKRYVDSDDVPVNANVPLAIAILQAKFEGVKEAAKDEPLGEPMGSGSPATSPPSSPVDLSQGSAPTP